MAVDQNPRITAAHDQLEISASKITQAQSGFYPQVYFSETFNRTTNPTWAFGTKLNQGVITLEDFNPNKLNDPEAINNFETAFVLDWSVFNGGRTRLGTKQSRENHQAASLMLKRTRQDVIANTASAYVGLLLARKNVNVVQKALTTAQAHLKLVQSRFKSGFVVKSDLLRAQVRIAELEQERLQAESQVKMSQAVLHAAMGTFGERSINPITPLERCWESKGSIEEWIAMALGNRPDLKQLRHRQTIAQDEMTKSRYEHLPTLNLVGTYQINSENFSEFADNYTVGAVARINLFSGHRISSKTKEAMAFLRLVQSTIKAMELGVRVETQKAFLQTQSAWKQIQVAQTAVTQAEEALRIVRNRYKSGLLTIVSLLDAEVASQQARTRHFKSMHDYKVARINLALAAGTIDTDFQ